jgi:predicted transcriptional regulator
MTNSLTIPNDILERAIVSAVREQLQAMDLESMRLLTSVQVADLLEVTPHAVRKFADVDHIDLGQRHRRWTLADIKGLIERRRVKARR